MLNASLNRVFLWQSYPMVSQGSDAVFYQQTAWKRRRCRTLIRIPKGDAVWRRADLRALALMLQEWHSVRPVMMSTEYCEYQFTLPKIVDTLCDARAQNEFGSRVSVQYERSLDSCSCVCLMSQTLPTMRGHGVRHTKPIQWESRVGRVSSPGNTGDDFPLAAGAFTRNQATITGKVIKRSKPSDIDELREQDHGGDDTDAGNSH